MSFPVLRRTVLSVAIAALATVSIAACGDKTAPAETSAPKAQAAADAKSVSAEDLCTYLKKSAPEWKAVGSEVGAMAQMTMGLAGFYDEQGAVPDGSDMDEKSQAECPEVRAEVLKAAGVESFTSL